MCIYIYIYVQINNKYNPDRQSEKKKKKKKGVYGRTRDEKKSPKTTVCVLLLFNDTPTSIAGHVAQS